MNIPDKKLPEFDDSVIRAMAKWPDVPQCFGWLELDRRGTWRIRGEPIRHIRSHAFLSRHYRPDEWGRWYVQNGPQQVFVDLEYTPWIYRYHAAGGIQTHTGVSVDEIEAAVLDEEGNMLLVTSLGIGALDDRDLVACSSLLQGTEDDTYPRSLSWHGKQIELGRIQRKKVSLAYGFEPNPKE